MIAFIIKEYMGKQGKDTITLGENISYRTLKGCDSCIWINGSLLERKQWNEPVTTSGNK